MPFWPEFLFKLSERDQQVTFLDPVFRATSSAAAAVAVAATLDLLQDGSRCMVLQSASVRGQPGAGQSCSRVSLYLCAPNTAPSSAGTIADFEPYAAAIVGKANSGNWSGSIIVPPKWVIAALGTYSAAGVANTVELHVSGILIPAGNMQRV